MQPLFIPLLMSAAASGACWFWNVYPSFKEEATLSAFGGSVASISIYDAWVPSGCLGCLGKYQPYTSAESHA